MNFLKLFSLLKHENSYLLIDPLFRLSSPHHCHSFVAFINFYNVPVFNSKDNLCFERFLLKENVEAYSALLKEIGITSIVFVHQKTTKNDESIFQVENINNYEKTDGNSYQESKELDKKKIFNHLKDYGGEGNKWEEEMEKLFKRNSFLSVDYSVEVWNCSLGGEEIKKICQQKNTALFLTKKVFFEETPTCLMIVDDEEKGKVVEDKETVNGKSFSNLSLLPIHSYQLIKDEIIFNFKKVIKKINKKNFGKNNWIKFIKKFKWSSYFLFQIGIHEKMKFDVVGLVGRADDHLLLRFDRDWKFIFQKYFNHIRRNQTNNDYYKKNNFDNNENNYSYLGEDEDYEDEDEEVRYAERRGGVLHLKILTSIGSPLVHRIKSFNKSCDQNHNYLSCSLFSQINPSVSETFYCCYGYGIDLLLMVQKEVNFTFELFFSTKDKTKSNNQSTGDCRWDDVVGHLEAGHVDLGVAPLTVDPERAELIDFSSPFMYQGLAILVRRVGKSFVMDSFLQPFKESLWILVGVSVHIVAIVLYLLDRFSPFGRFKVSKSDDAEEDALNLSSAMWFAWGVLLNSGIGEGTPRSFSGRVLGMVWAGFGMIIVASYTANLAAFLVLDRPEDFIQGIDDARLRNPQSSFKFATISNSLVMTFFKRQVELAVMYETMLTNKQYLTVQEAVQDIKDGILQAFIWDSLELEHLSANDCSLAVVGEVFGRSSYAIGLKKNSPLTEKVSMAILKLHENGALENLERKWILVRDVHCPESDPSPATLGLNNMAGNHTFFLFFQISGVFVMVAWGILAGVLIIFIEIAYKRHRHIKEKKIETVKNAANRWRNHIEKRKIIQKHPIKMSLSQYQT